MPFSTFTKSKREACHDSSSVSALEIINRRVEELKVDPANPRLHSDKQLRQIAASIRSFGFNVPILVDANAKIIAGHGRLAACKFLDIKAVPTICLEHLSVDQARAFMIADNRLTENSTWDDRLLAEQLKILAAAEIDFSIEDTGFEMGEIDVLIEGLESADSKDDADQVPAISDLPAVSRIGDLWLLGRHRVLCGSALQRDDYSTLMDRRRASAVFVDPPYNVPIAGNVGGLGKIHHREFAMASGEMSSAEFTDFLSSTFSLLVEHSEPGSLQFVCMDWRHMKEVLDAGEQAYSELKNLCVWAKDNAGMGSLYRSQHELVFVYKNGTSQHRNNIQLGQFGRYRTNVWQYPGVNSFARSSGEGNLLALHPTVKPVALVADAIMDCTMRSGIVLDSFLGSGTTVIAAERTGRICHGMELDPLYVDTIVRRWQTFTGNRAVHVGMDKSFEELQEVRDGNE